MMANNNDDSPSDGLIVADMILSEPEKGLLGRRTRQVPRELFPKPDQVLVLRGDVDFTQLGWGQVPDPSDPQWLDARAATLVRRQWREELVLYVPSSSSDRQFTVIAPLNSKVTSPVTFLAHADPTSSDVYRDAIGTTARDLGKRFDARHSDRFETILRARLRAWMRMKRSEIPGVAVELGLVEVRPPEKAIKHVESATDAVWSEEREQLDHRNRLAGWSRHDEERTERATFERRRLDDDKHIELIEGELDNERLLAELEAEQRREHAALDGQSLYEQRALEAEQKREPLRQELETERDLFERDRRWAALEESKQEELLALEADRRNDVVRRELEQARTAAARDALADDAESYEELLANPHGAAALAIARGEISSEKVFDTEVEEGRQLEAKLFALIGTLIQNEGNDDIDWGEAGRHQVMAEIKRLHERLQGSFASLPSGSTAIGESPLDALGFGTDSNDQSDPTDIAEDDLDEEVNDGDVVDVHQADEGSEEVGQATQR